MQKWLEQLGIVKKLQLGLVLSWIIIILLAMQLIDINKNNESREEEMPIIKNIDLEQARIFARDYLEKFFSASSNEDINYLQLRTQEDLFIKNIYPELTNRRKEKITSQLNIEQLYLEEINNHSVKAVCFAIEEFPSGSYQKRQLSIEIIIELEQDQLKVSSIPVFKVNR